MKKCVVVINPNSGRGSHLEKRMGEILNKYGYKEEIYFTMYPHHAEEIIYEIPDADLLISVGGDGTFSEAMNGNLKRKKQILMSHIPVGTTNDVGHMYGLSSDILKSLELILEGVVKKVDICSINGRCFVYVASFGKFMEIPYETPQKLKKRIGHLAYLISGAKELFRRTNKYNVTYSIDGVKHNGKYTFIIISNANRIAGINNFYRDMKLDDSKIEVMLCSLYKKIDIIKAFYNLKTNNLKGVSGVETFKCEKFTVKFLNKAKPWCVDGEEFFDDTKSYKIEILKNVKMRLPKKNLKKLFINYN